MSIDILKTTYSPDAIYRRSFGKVLEGSVAAVSLPPDEILKANAEMQQAWDVHESTSLRNLTPRICVHDAANVIYKICTDVMHGRDNLTLKHMLVEEDRLRGLGILLIAISLAGMSTYLLAV